MKHLFISIFVSIGIYSAAQNTVGLTHFEAEGFETGYYLFYPNFQSDVYLIDHCGALVHQWIGSPSTSPGSNAYLLESGDLLKSSNSQIQGTSFGAGGAGGLIEIQDWDSNVLYSRQLADTLIRQHHDVQVLPNGNILCLVWERYNLDQIENKGFDSSNISLNELWCDAIYELDPTLDSIIWKWQSWNHLIQDKDPDLANYASIKDQPGKIDLNYHEYNLGTPDWMHCNSLDYNAELDQILVSVRAFSEVWIIDHSTTNIESMGDVGGNSNKGGQLLFRWGNPHAYNAGLVDDRKFFGQHDAQWIKEFVDPSNQFYNDIAVFNNFLPNNTSLGQIIKPSLNNTNNYNFSDDYRYLPNDVLASFSHPIVENNFSTRASSIQVLNNGNVLMCAARQGRSFEVNAQGELVWEYVTPFRLGSPVAQFTELNLADNFTFQMKKYPIDFPGFSDKELNPLGYLESNPNPLECEEVLSDFDLDEKANLKIYPNPIANQLLTLELPATINESIQFDIIGINGEHITSLKQIYPSQSHQFEFIEPGYYFLVNDKLGIKKPIVIIK